MSVQSKLRRTNLPQVATKLLLECGGERRRVLVRDEAFDHHPLEQEIPQHGLRARVGQHARRVAAPRLGVGERAVLCSRQELLVGQAVPVEERHALRDFLAAERDGIVVDGLVFEQVQELWHLQ